MPFHIHPPFNIFWGVKKTRTPTKPFVCFGCLFRQVCSASSVWQERNLAKRMGPATKAEGRPRRHCRGAVRRQQALMLSELRKVWCDTWVSSLVACTGPATGRAVFVTCILCLSKDLFLCFLRNLVSVVYRAARFSFFKSTAALKVKGGRGWNDRLSREHLLLSV